MGAWLLHSGWWLPSGLAKGDELRPKAAESARQKWVRFPVPAGLAEAVSRGIEMILEFRRTSRKHARDAGQTPPEVTRGWHESAAFRWRSGEEARDKMVSLSASGGTAGQRKPLAIQKLCVAERRERQRARRETNSAAPPLRRDGERKLLLPPGIGTP